MALSIQKLSASNSAKNALITIINSSNINIFEPIPMPIPTPTPNQNKNLQLLALKYEYFNNANYSITEIPPPYCSVCNQFMTTNQCNSMIQPKSCPLL